MTAGLDKAQNLLRGAEKIVVLTGAGISVESGLATFRGKHGFWEKYHAQDLASPEAFASDPALVWRFYNTRRKAAEIDAPNAAHLALARLELGRLRQAKSFRKKGENSPLVLITQNVDGLHQQAGSQNVVELHGSIWKVRCTGCGDITTEHPVELPALPRCQACRSLLRPHVVWFGENLEPELMISAEHHVRHCDVLLVVGTSAVAEPAASYPLMAARRGVSVVEANVEETALSAVAAVTLVGKAGELVPLLAS